MNKERPNRRDFLKAGGIGILSLAIPGWLKEKEEPKAGRVNFSSGGVMLLDGERFFPIVAYGLPGDPTKLVSWKRAKESGFNTVTMFYPTSQSLDYAESLGLKTIIRLDYLFDHYVPNAGELLRVEKGPGVISWEIDEPDQNWSEQDEVAGVSKKDALFNLLEWLSKRSELPLRVTTSGPARLMEFTESTVFLRQLYERYPNIISGPDDYENRVAEEVSSYVDFWKKETYLGGKQVKTVWQVTSAHSEDERLFGRSLTYNDILYQTMSGIVAGSCGVGFYDSPWGCDLDSCDISPEKNAIASSFSKHLEDVSRVNRLINDLMPGLTGIERWAGRMGEERVRILVEDGGQERQYLMYSNTLESRVSIIIYTPHQRFVHAHHFKPTSSWVSNALPSLLSKI